MTYSPYEHYEEPKKPSKGFGSFMIFLFFAFLTFIVYTSFDGKLPDIPTPDDIVISDVKLEDTYVVRVYETETSKMPVWFVKLLNADKLWVDFFVENKMSRYSIDPTSNQEDAETFLAAANKRGISPPCWIHCKKGGTVLSVSKFQETDTPESIEAKIRKCK